MLVVRSSCDGDGGKRSRFLGKRERGERRLTRPWMLAAERDRPTEAPAGYALLLGDLNAGDVVLRNGMFAARVFQRCGFRVAGIHLPRLPVGIER
jgi:hypothetical protein